MNAEDSSDAKRRKTDEDGEEQNGHDNDEEAKGEFTRIITYGIFSYASNARLKSGTQCSICRGLDRPLLEVKSAYSGGLVPGFLSGSRGPILVAVGFKSAGPT